MVSSNRALSKWPQDAGNAISKVLDSKLVLFSLQKIKLLAKRLTETLALHNWDSSWMILFKESLPCLKVIAVIIIIINFLLNQMR